MCNSLARLYCKQPFELERTIPKNKNTLQEKHNKGDVPHTSKFRPWKVETYIAFESEEKAVDFEHYLKSGSGHAFAKRHF